MVVGTAMGFSNLATVVLSIALAFLFGYTLTSIPLRRSGMTVPDVVRTAVVADTVSITIMEVIDNAFVVAVPGALNAGVGDPLFWASLLGGFVLAFAPAFFVNRANIRRGKGCCPGMRARPTAESADTDAVSVELLYFDGCPGYGQLLPRLRHLVAEAGGDPQQILLRAVETVEAADELRFLGSPTLRVNGEDVDPGAGTRYDFGLKCRLYRSEDGQSGVPPEEWIRAALHV